MAKGKGVRISLANKCQLLFGAAVVLILTAALAVVWLRMGKLVERVPLQRAEDFAQAYLADQIQLGGALTPIDTAMGQLRADADLTLSLIDAADFDRVAKADPFLDAAIERFNFRPEEDRAFEPARDADGGLYYRYARAIRKSDVARLRAASVTGGSAPDGEADELDAMALSNPLEMVLLIHLRDPEAGAQETINRIYILVAGVFAGLLAIGVFWFITTRIILSPVRVLRVYAAKVSDGDLNIRSDINTGDEFEELSDMFNTMLESLKSNQDKLRQINKSLDLKLGELAETNVALYEADKMKGEFLANVSHELRTPLNSIIGFAEVLQETLAGRTGPMDEKRKRYASHIITSSRRLLDLINDLLDLAKIEAGRMDLHLSQVSITDTCEGLAALIKPQAEKRNLELRLRLEPNLPIVTTDAGKLQQVLFNFLSNAVKFTPERGVVTLAAAAVGPSGGLLRNADDESANAGPTAVRISVSDTGPGIAAEDHDKIFDKFTQLDPGVTKQHGGTGLGLTISKELAELLGARIELDSDTGAGATFSLIVPVALPKKSAPLMPETPEPAAAR